PAGFGLRRDVASELATQTRSLGHQLAVALRHHPFLQIEVVLEADADVATHRDRSRHQRPLVEADADHLPVRARREGIYLVHEVAGGSWDSAEDAHDEAELV